MHPLNSINEVYNMKRIVKWSLDGNVLKISRFIGSEGQTEIAAEFDLIKLFPDIDKLNDVQKQLVIFGTKQKLMDTGASEVGDSDGKIKSAKAKWTELLSGKWSGDRVNATGAAENKRIISTVKEITKTISLEGLSIKKVLYPDTFTAEDEAKLQDFLKRAKQGK